MLHFQYIKLFLKMSQYLQENTCVNEIAGLLAVPQNVLGRPLKTFIKPFEAPQGGPQLY